MLRDPVSLDNRPFYAFILARHEGAIDEILAQLSQSLLQNGQMLRFSTDDVRCTLTAAEVPTLSSRPSVSWLMLPPSVVARMAGAAGAVAEYQCAWGEDFPIVSVLADLELAYRRWDGAPRPTAEPGF